MLLIFIKINFLTFIVKAQTKPENIHSVSVSKGANNEGAKAKGYEIWWHFFKERDNS